MRGDRKSVFWKLLSSLNPISYDKLAEDHLIDAVLYVPKILSIAFLIMFAISIPLLISIPGHVNDILSKTTSIKINVEVNNNDPIRIPEKFPFAIIDRHANSSSSFDSRILVTNESVMMKPMMCQLIPITCPLYDFGNVKIDKNLGGYSDVLSHKDFYNGFIATIFFMMLPAILIMAFLLYLVKYLAIALIFTILAFAITRMARFEIRFSEILNISFYALTAMMLIEIILIPFEIRLYYAHQLVFLIYAILGILRTGYHDRTPKRRIKKQRGQYVELGHGHSGHEEY